MKDVSVIIVNYNTRALCAQAIGAVSRAARGVGVEVLVVDNSSRPEERYSAELPTLPIRVFSGVENRGFGHACNIGARQAAGRYVLFLNSDTILDDGALDRVIDYMDRQSADNADGGSAPDGGGTHGGDGGGSGGVSAHGGSAPDGAIGVLGIKMLFSDGAFDHSCKRGFPTPLNALYYYAGLDLRFPKSRRFGGYHLTYLNPDETCDVDSVSGSFLLMPRALFLRLGGFDEAFFMYGEDLDLCYRAKAAGFRVVYFAGASMLHLKGQSGLLTQNPAVLRAFYDSMLLFYEKHYREKYGAVTAWLVRTAIRAKYRLEAL
ncbi:MAG: glycosyltransferase family 2 protein [Clostridiales bacterium]|nr:glycosyltransferase family 2 protein [Clostridiales bacterium]